MAEVLDGVLRNVGPQNVDQAGELVKKVGVHHQGKRLIRAVARQKPAAVVAAQSRPEDRFRTMFLDDEEVAEQTIEAFGDDVEIRDVIYGRVRGKGAPEEKLAVVVLFTTEPAGRTARGVLRYEDFEESRDRFDESVREGRFNPYVTEEDPVEHRKELAAARAELRRLKGHVAGGQPGGSREATVDVAGVAGEESDSALKALVPHLSDEGLREVLASDPSASVVKAVEAELEERAEKAQAGAGGAEAPDGEALVDGNVPEVEKRLKGATEAELDAAEEAEKAKSKPRRGVLDAIKSARG